MGPEKRLQQKVIEWARKKYADRILVRKFQGTVYGTSGYPDVDFLVKGKTPRVFMIEFKAPGGSCTELQLQRHKELRAIGVHVYVADNADAAKGIIDSELRRGAGKSFNPRREVKLG